LSYREAKDGPLIRVLRLPSAAEELLSYLTRMGIAEARLEPATAYRPDLPGIGMPAVADAKWDDAIGISMENGMGIVAGGNPRSVLLAAYRLLYEAGCRWVRPARRRGPPAGRGLRGRLPPSQGHGDRRGGELRARARHDRLEFPKDVEANLACPDPCRAGQMRSAWSALREDVWKREEVLHPVMDAWLFAKAIGGIAETKAAGG